jgi:hypothetical protein
MREHEAPAINPGRHDARTIVGSREKTSQYDLSEGCPRDADTSRTI